MGLIKLLREGTWYSTCKSDPRFNLSGRGLVGLGDTSKALAAVTALAEELDIEIPEDCQVGYMKD